MNIPITDNLNVLSKVTIPKVWNSLKLTSSYYYSKITKRSVQWGVPVSISIEPTTACNLRCPECPSGKREFSRPTGMLSTNFFEKTINELEKELLYLTFYFQGEPYLNPNFLNMVSYASKKNIYTATSTNAHFLNEENAKQTVKSGLDRLIISIDGTSQDTYEQYRVGGNLNKVIEGTKNVIKWKKQLHSKTPHIIFQFLVVRPNEHQVSKVKKLAHQIGVNEVRIKTAQIYDFKKGNPLIPSIDKYSRYKENKYGNYEIKNDNKNHCWRLWSSTVITWDGLVVPCCFDKDAIHQLGDLKKTSFSAVWNNKNYKDFRSNVLISRSTVDICKNCTEGTKVWS